MTNSLHDWSGEISFEPFEVDYDAIANVFDRPMYLMIDLTEMDDIARRAGGFRHIVLRLDGKMHDFTPSEVLDALYRERERMESE